MAYTDHPSPSKEQSAHLVSHPSPTPSDIESPRTPRTPRPHGKILSHAFADHDIACLERTYTTFRRVFWALIILYIPLLIAYLWLYWRVKTFDSCCLGASTSFSEKWDQQEATPAAVENMGAVFPSLASSGALKYGQRTWPVKLHDNPFAGEPREELDAAWHELFEDIRINVTAADLEFYNVTSIPLAPAPNTSLPSDHPPSEGGGGYGFAAELGVFHELHCLKKIRHWIHREYYGLVEGKISEGELREWPAHVDHCVEMLRESIMCHGDASLTSFEWVDVGRAAETTGEDGGGKGGGTGGEKKARLTAVAKGWHTCVDWGTLLEWVRGRSVKIFEEGVLVGPGEEEGLVR